MSLQFVAFLRVVAEAERQVGALRVGQMVVQKLMYLAVPASSKASWPHRATLSIEVVRTPSVT